MAEANIQAGADPIQQASACSWSVASLLQAVDPASPRSQRCHGASLAALAKWLRTSKLG